MTDYERVLKLHRSLGVVMDEEVLEISSWNDEPRKTLTISQGLGDSNPKVTGYAGFHTMYEFDMDGKFLRVGAWE